MNAGVILAAGEGTRMGFPKQIAEYKGETLIKQTYKLIELNKVQLQLVSLDERWYS